MRLARRVFLLPVRFYQRFISRYTPPTCRFHPTCSEFALVAVERFGVFRGAWMTVKRLARCHPFASHGEDPVPDRRKP